jgi:hypothetical protein
MRLLANAKTAAQKIAESSSGALGGIYGISADGTYETDYQGIHLPSK